MAPNTSENDVNNRHFGICCACNKPLKREGLRFPKSKELRAQWLDIIMTKTPHYPGKEKLANELGLLLCMEHFEAAMLIQKTENGNIVHALRKGGVPTIFNSIPDTLNRDDDMLCDVRNVMDVDVTKGEDEDISICYEAGPEAKQKTSTSSYDVNIPNENYFNSVSESEDNANSNDVIPSIATFILLLKQKDDKYFHPWRVLFNEKSVLFSLFDSDCKYLVQSFTVDENLKLSVYYHGQLFQHTGLNLLLGTESKLDTWTKFKKLVLFLYNITQQKDRYKLQLQHACKLIQDCIENGMKGGCTEKDIKKWKFSLNQLEIANGVKDPTYSRENVQWALNVFNANQAGYRKIYESDVLTLPHPASVFLFSKQEAMRRNLIRAKMAPKKNVNVNVPQTNSSTAVKVATPTVMLENGLTSRNNMETTSLASVSNTVAISQTNIPQVNGNDTGQLTDSSSTVIEIPD